jgi:hypothetical protein
MATGGGVRLVPDEDPIAVGIAGEQPAVPVGAFIELSRSNRHDGDPF